MPNAIAHHPLTNPQPFHKQQPMASFLPQFILWAWWSVVWNITLVSWDQLPCLCVLTTCYVPPALPLVGHKPPKNPWHNISTAQQHLQQQGVTNIILILNPKHSIIPATRKEPRSQPKQGQMLTNGRIIPKQCLEKPFCTALNSGIQKVLPTEKPTHKNLMSFIFLSPALNWYKHFWAPTVHQKHCLPECKSSDKLFHWE